MYVIKLQDADESIFPAELPDEIAETLLGFFTPGADAEPAINAAADIVTIEATGPYALADYLRPVGGWDETELADETMNRKRLLWIIGCELAENGEAHVSTY